MLTQHICKACGHKWTPRTEDPLRCPRCQTRDWKALTTDTGNALGDGQGRSDG